jgi:hypothetical protein
MAEGKRCVICGGEISRENDAGLLEAQATGNLQALMGDRGQHLFPIMHDGELICVGTPRIARYLLPSGLGDLFDAGYDAKKAERYQMAHAKIRHGD